MAGGQVIRVVLADAHRIVREGIRLLLDAKPLAGGHTLSVVGEAANGRQAFEVCGATRPDVAVIDWTLTDPSGLEVARRLTVLRSAPKVIFLSTSELPQSVALARKVGAASYLSKTGGIGDLSAAIASAAAGEPGPFPQYEGEEAVLSLREREVLSHLARGCHNQEIAHLLAISKHTVNSHRMRLMRKLEAHDVASLTRIAVELGMAG